MSPRPSWSGDALALEDDLRRSVRGEVRFDAGSRALYATDASNYRQVPIGVVVPRDEEDVIATVSRLPPSRRADPATGRRHQPRRPVLQRRRGARLLQAHLSGVRGSRSDRAHRPRAARHGAGRPAPRGRPARAHLRARPRHPRLVHARRDDRQQLLRRALGDGRAHRRTTSRRSTCSPTTALRLTVGATRRGRARPHRPRRRPARGDLSRGSASCATATPT